MPKKPDEHFQRLAISRQVEIEKLRQCIKEWEEKAATWLASPEAAQRLDGYRELAQKLNVAEMQRDELLAALTGLVRAVEEDHGTEFQMNLRYCDAAIAKCKETNHD